MNYPSLRIDGKLVKMEFFEKAHVSKKQSSKKDSKSEEIVKKQLRLMLQGYKRSDNDLIKHSGNSSNDIIEAHRYLDDSASVSGFSDLELTNSETEDDTNRATTSKSVGKSTASTDDVDLSHLSEMNSDTDDNLDELHLEDSNSHDSISECRQNNESLSECIESSEDLDTSEDMTYSDIDEILSETGSESRDSEAFDPDGALASKILQNLGKNHNKPTLNAKKRKVEEDPNKSKSKKKELKNKLSNKKQGNDNEITMEALTINNDDDEEASISDSNSTQHSGATNESSPFISITVRDMPKQRLSDILEEYKHSTVKHLQDVQYENFNTDMFSSQTDMVVEDADSLVPELGDEDLDNIIEELDNDNTIEDLDNDNIIEELQNDNIIETIDKGTNSDPEEVTTTDYDSTMQSDTERQESTEEKVTNPVKVYHGKNCYIFVLRHPAELYLNGKVRVKPIAGTVEVFGHTLKNVVDLYAPNNNFAQCFKTIESPNSDYGVFRKLTGEGLTVPQAEEIVTRIGSFDGIISVSKLIDARMDFVESNVSMDLFSKCNKANGSLRKASTDLGCSLVLKKPWRYFEESDSWDHAVSCGLGK